MPTVPVHLTIALVLIANAEINNVQDVKKMSKLFSTRSHSNTQTFKGSKIMRVNKLSDTRSIKTSRKK